MSRVTILFLHVLIIAACGLVYELLAGTLASYVLGDSVTQFSMIIGLYLSALGVGAWLSRYIERHLARIFVEVELAVAILGGVSAPLLFLSFALLDWFRIALFGIVFGIGVLVGLELPLLMRILKDEVEFKDLVSRVLSFDYIGALVASFLFPLFFVPKLGLIRTSLVFGILNAAVALWATYVLRSSLGGVTGLRVRSALVITILTVGVIKSDQITSYAEDRLFNDPIVFAETTPYQRIVVTRKRDHFNLYLSGNLQFSSYDEYRYHEALVHPAMLSHPSPKRILVLGGGDGLGLREVLRYPGVEKVTLVDIDPHMTGLWKKLPLLADLNENSFADPRVEVVNADAMVWLSKTTAPDYDVAIVDFPDPNSFSLGKLYTRRFYRLLRSRLSESAVISIQATSPVFARTSYWCVLRTIEASGLQARPYRAAVPTFGVWGFILASAEPPQPSFPPPPGLKFINEETLASLFTIPADMQAVDAEINRLDNQVLVRYYHDEWHRWK
ncbi:MAG: polyamine aminopropyltransferase [Planctomycetota bacterium]